MWELTIKASLGKLDLKGSVKTLVEFQTNQNNIKLLSISLAHFDLLEKFPYHHKDPFDRLLAAQAIADQFHLISTDDIFDQYGVKRPWLT